MKRTILFAAMTVAIFVSCSKSNTGADATTVTASTTTAVVGQTVALQVSTSSNVVSWTVTPSATATTQYNITALKTNTVSFSQPGLYIVGVRARNIEYDSTHHQNLDSCWHHGGGDHGGCTHGVDSASIIISVTK